MGFVVSAAGQERVFLSAPRRSMPSNFCVVENTTETINFINSLRQRLVKPPVSGTRAVRSRLDPSRRSPGAPRWIGPYIDFATMQHISPASALILAAEYDRARSLRASRIGELGKLFVVNPQDWDESVLETLFEVGFFDILDIAHTISAPDGERRILRFRSGKENDATAIGGMLDEIERMFKDVGLNANDACFELNGALGEAMENTVRCAYPSGGSFHIPHVGRWWMTGALSKSLRRMNVAIFDQGVSIPGSLKGWKFYGGFAERFLNAVGIPPDLSEPRYDGRVIELAIEESATSTNLEKHGKGLGHIKAFVDSCQSGRLTIVSRYGFYMYEKGRKPVVKSLNANLGGTLVEWDVMI
ncbi:MULTISPECIES: hypothetical protein [unclassified Mesorhizobium]|uniref:hypothetical protein n=1 Tax=unclassified Mesorhizobium TaxID=325217 RepID=UPI00112BAAD3|nr:MULTISPECIES: hypothetical protein [unclassified Mesorhizobium]TPJ98596.1 hypothetical protein FJ489_06625 [Mesorhizobium sp. B2-5-12]TPK28758.1 hypothetical protein FJ562_00015 [Mesorhizobium sp. B2-5-6]